MAPAYARRGRPGLGAAWGAQMRWFIPVLIATGCGSASDVDAGDIPDTEPAWTGCGVVDEVALGLDAVSPLGFSGDDLLLWAEGRHTTTLSWSVGGTTGLSLDVVYDGLGARFLEVAWRAQEGTEKAIPADCTDRLVVGARIDVVTDDGAFDESFDAELGGTQGDTASFGVTLDPATLGGAYTVREVDPASFDTVRLFVDGRFDALGTAGSVVGQGEGTDSGTDPDGVAFALRFDVATWGAVGE